MRRHHPYWLTLLTLLVACGPTAQESQARKIVQPSLVGMFGRLPHPPVLAGQYLPVATSSLSGSYYSLAATARAEYWTEVPGQEVCESFLRVLKEEMKFTTNTSARGECTPRYWETLVFHSIDGERDGGLITIHFGATDDTRDNQRGNKGRTEVDIWLTHRLDKARSRECAPNESGRIKPHCEHRWHEPLPIPTSPH